MSLFMYGYYESPCDLPSHFVTQFDKDYLVVVFFLIPFLEVKKGKLYLSDFPGYLSWHCLVVPPGNFKLLNLVTFFIK